MNDPKKLFKNEAEATEVFKDPEHPNWLEALEYLRDYGSPESQQAMQHILNMPGIREEIQKLADTREAWLKMFDELPVFASDEHGNKLVDAESVANALGVSVEEVINKAKEIEETYGLNVFHKGKPFRVN